jgi:hypothetical protein
VIPSIDTYLYDEIEEKLQIILSNRYIIEEILKGVQEDVAKNFINAYTGDNAYEIPIRYTMPQDKESLRGSIYIGLREGEESNASLGNMEETYDVKETGLIKEQSTIQAEKGDHPRNYFELSKEIGSFNNIEGLIFSTSDHMTIEKNRIYFAYDPTLIGETFIVVYTEKLGDEIGMKKGFLSQEHYSVLTVSTNMDTVRCLDQIMKAIFILMRANPEENTNFLLQKLQFGQIEEMKVGGDEEAVPEILYGRETIVTYTTSYSLDAPITDAILKEILINLKFKGGELYG